MAGNNNQNGHLEQSQEICASNPQVSNIPSPPPPPPPPPSSSIDDAYEIVPPPPLPSFIPLENDHTNKPKGKVTKKDNKKKKVENKTNNKNNNTASNKKMVSTDAPVELLNTLRVAKWEDRLGTILTKSKNNYFPPLIKWVETVKSCSSLKQTEPTLKKQLVTMITQVYKNKICSKVDWGFQPIGNTLYLLSGQVYKIPDHIKKEIRLPSLSPHNQAVQEAANLYGGSQVVTLSEEPTNDSQLKTSKVDASLPTKVVSVENSKSQANSNLQSIQKPLDNEIPVHDINSIGKTTKNTNSYQYQAAMELEKPQAIQIIPDPSMLNSSREPKQQKLAKRLTSTSDMNAKSQKKARLAKFQKASTPDNGNQYKEDYSNLNKILNKSQFFDKNKPLIGTNTTLEKPYLRLTSEAKCENIRPLPVLQKALKLVLNKYTNGSENYQYFCSQLKSIRQDLRVQLIETDFTSRVYIMHAEVALKNGDLGEFNQCLSSLSSLYDKMKPRRNAYYNEFSCFSVLYSVLMNDFNTVLNMKGDALSQMRMEKEKTTAEETTTSNANTAEIDLKDVAMNVCLLINEYVMTNNYNGFFKMYKYLKKIHCMTCNQSIRSLTFIYHFVEQCLLEKIRIKTFAYMATCYRRISLSQLQHALGFSDVTTVLEYCNKLKVIDSLVIQESLDGKDTSYLDCKPVASIVWANFEKSQRIDIKGQL